MIMMMKKQLLKGISLNDIVMTENSPNYLNIPNLIPDTPRKKKLRKELLNVERNWIE